MTAVFISLGSNLAPERHLCAAVRALAERFELVRMSPVYQSPPVGADDQPDFLNAAVLVRTDLAPDQCKTVLREIEDGLGRVRTGTKFDPRTIDLDITLFGNQVLVLGERHIPDPDLLRYAHVAVPIAALQPDYIHPETGESLAQIAAGFRDHNLMLRHDVPLTTTHH